MSPLRALPVILLAASAHAEILVGLDTANALYQGAAVDDGGTTGSASGISALDNTNHPSGFTFNVTFTPVAADLTGTILLAEIGGTSNGAGLFLVNGIPSLMMKQSSGDNPIATGFPDTELPATASQSSIGTLTAGTEYSVSGSWDHQGTLELIAKTGAAAPVIDTITITGTFGNWSGNDTFSAGLFSNPGSTGGLSGGNDGNDFGPPFDATDVLSFSGTFTEVVFWNQAFLTSPALSAPEIRGFQVTSLPSSGNLRAHWLVDQGTVGDPVSITITNGATTFASGLALRDFIDFDPAGSTSFTLTASNAQGSVTSVSSPSPTNAFNDAVIADQPIAHFRFNESSGSTLIIDSADNPAPHNGIASGGVGTGSPGALDGAANFDGISGTILSDFILDPGATLPGFTIESIVRRLDGTTFDNPTIVSQTNLAGTGRLNLSAQGDGLVTSFLGGGNSGVVRPADARLYAEAWCHLVIVADASVPALRFYLDGELIGDTSQSSDPAVANVFLEATTGQHIIGSNKFQGGDFWLGDIDEIAIYDTLLDDPNGDGDLSDSRIPAHRDAFVSEASGLLGFGTQNTFIEIGMTATLDVKVGPDVTSIMIDNGVGSVTATNGSATVNVSPTATTTYTITTQSPAGTQIQSATIEVGPNTSPELIITGFTPNAGGGYLITFQGIPGRSYIITASTTGQNFTEISDDANVDAFGIGTGSIPASLEPVELYRIEELSN